MIRGEVPCEGAELTARERGVLERVLLGETNKEIAAALGCSVKTVEFHVSNILKKVGVESRLQLIVEVLSRVRVSN
ncbi:MAG: helix-turn-helix domain-containing protein [Myxococcota bacterium]